MLSRIALVLSFHVFIYILKFQSAEAESWFRIGYWYSSSGFPVSDINSALYTHLICAFADVNTSSFELSVSSSNEQRFSIFTNTVRLKNPSITTLLSTGGDENSDAIQSMMNNASSRKPFIQSSIRMVRLYGFQGLDLYWPTIKTTSDVNNLGKFFQEWRAAAKSEVETNSTLQELILTAVVEASPDLDYWSYPVESMRSNLNWIHVNGYDYLTPVDQNFTAAPSALYDPASDLNTDYSIKAWIENGLPANKLVLGLPFYGYAWKLQNPNNNAIGAPAIGPVDGYDGGSISYKDIKINIQQNGAGVLYNDTYVTNYCSIGSTWIGFDDVEVVQKKVSYVREKQLLGYYVWHVSDDDDNFTLGSAAAEQVGNDKEGWWKILVIIMSVTATVILMLGVTIYYQRKRIFKSIGMVNATKNSQSEVNEKVAGPFHGDLPDLQVYRFIDIEVATDKFSYENKLGQGGYGPVYKGILINGQEIAVKKLSISSTQGFEEFKNEVTLTARLQHVNLVRLLGFCIEKGEQMLVYEYMANKSLDFYLFDPIRRHVLDWNKRVCIIEGVMQGLLYLQEYSRFTIIHRDLKASNILLDHEMRPKISDFGIARIFTKDEQEANTSKIVGTYGYVPPEYVKRGVYSTKFDVYSFGVLLLQIISGKKTSGFYGDEDLKLLDYAYELWKEGRGMEFVDLSLDDTSTTCKLMKCMQIALLCVQEHANERPSMLEVSSMLRNEDNSLAIPKKPAFSKVKDEEETNECQPLEIVSVNDTTITETVGR